MYCIALISKSEIFYALQSVLKPLHQYCYFALLRNRPICISISIFIRCLYDIDTVPFDETSQFTFVFNFHQMFVLFGALFKEVKSC